MAAVLVKRDCGVHIVAHLDIVVPSMRSESNEKMSFLAFDCIVQYPARLLLETSYFFVRCCGFIYPRQPEGSHLRTARDVHNL